MTKNPKRLTAASVVTNRLLQSQIAAIVGQVVAHHKLIEKLTNRVANLETIILEVCRSVRVEGRDTNHARPIADLDTMKPRHNPAKIRRKKA